MVEPFKAPSLVWDIRFWLQNNDTWAFSSCLFLCCASGKHAVGKGPINANAMGFQFRGLDLISTVHSLDSGEGPVRKIPRDVFGIRNVNRGCGCRCSVFWYMSFCRFVLDNPVIIFFPNKFDIFTSRLYKKKMREKQSAYLFYWAIDSPFWVEGIEMD